MEKGKTEMRRLGKSLQWYLLKLPCLFLLMVAGYLLEWIVSLPFILACHWDRPRDFTVRGRKGYRFPVRKNRF